jgi:ubiquinone/menaquinone biosynthesis C-methylase UbiE
LRESEWNRLVQDGYHKLEYIVMMHFLEKYLPKEGLILDAGGGPGRYTIELAKRGYDVVLHDLSPKCLEIAVREIEKAGVKHRVKRVIEGSVLDLSNFTNQSFDATLCLGALSHLIDQKDRDLAASELVRVTKEKAPLFVSVIGYYGVLRTVLQRLPHEFLDPSHKEMFLKGVHRAEWHQHETDRSFPDAYFFHPKDLEKLFVSRNVRTLEMATCEGLSGHLQEATNEIFGDKQKWDFWVEILLKTCTDPTILGIGEHFIYIGIR